ncbi:MAG: glycosyl transferase family 2, partial [Frankiales bacterium]|nr:glycosyl transferase family 2 [Frankiales bacterium]
LRTLLASLPLDAEVVDGRPPGTVRAALAVADVVVTASRTAPDGDAETLGLVNLEALACGAPLVTTAHGGVPEAVGDTALLVPEDGDVVGALAARVEELLAEPGTWAERGRRGRARVAARYELGARVADLEQLWVALADGVRGEDLPRAVPPGGPLRASVVLVTHDRRALLERTLEALAAQTRPAEEVVVVDNGSTDGTAELLASRVREGRPAGLRVLTRDANLPVAEGRNLAVAASRGEVVVFTDDDCRPRPTWLEALLAGFREDVALVQGRTTADPAQPLERLSRTQWTPAEFGLYETCNVAYTRAALDAAGPPAPEGPFALGFARVVADALGARWQHLPFGEDTELGWRVRRTGARSRFAVHAVVDHEVSPPDRPLLLRRAALSAAFPVVVREVPELRRTFLWHGVVLGPQRAALWLGTAGLAAAVASRDLRPALLALPYLDRVLGLRTLHVPDGRRRRLCDGAFLVRRDLVESAALLRGSWRTGTVVL